jgi:hypothetical protein
MIMVHDLSAASADFTRLGFRIRPGGRFSVGLENAIIRFGAGGPYLELLSIYRRGDPAIRDNEEFLDQGEGAMYVGLEVASAVDTANRLRDLGLEVQGPTPGTIKPEGVEWAPPVLWQSLGIQHGASSRSDPLFFTEYNEAARAEMEARNPEYARKREADRTIPHPNGAYGLASAWLAVDQLEKATQRYEALGFPRTREYTMDQLQCRVVELALDRGSLRLMESTGHDGPLDKLLALHCSQLEVPGVSLVVPSVNQVLGSLPSDLAATLESFDGPRGRQTMIPPDIAHGLWIELLERPVDSA